MMDITTITNKLNPTRNEQPVMSDTLAFLEKFKGDFEKMKQAAPDMVKGFGGMFLNI
jgi:hypothetical protein